MLKESDQTERGCGMQGLRSPACLDRPIGQTDRPIGQTYRTDGPTNRSDGPTNRTDL